VPKLLIAGKYPLYPFICGLFIIEEHFTGFSADHLEQKNTNIVRSKMQMVRGCLKRK